jgi:hypothetical protein
LQEQKENWKIDFEASAQLERGKTDPCVTSPQKM